MANQSTGTGNKYVHESLLPAIRSAAALGQRRNSSAYRRQMNSQL